MNNKTLKRFTIVAGFLALGMGMFPTLETKAVAPVLGCYQSYIIDCPGFGLFGQWKMCDFTGSYGPPYTCTETNCSGTSGTNRRCVDGGAS